MRGKHQVSTAAVGSRSVPSGRVVQRLALSRGVTFAGGGGAFWALSVVLYAETHSATWVAAAALASFSIPAFLSPAAGLLGDRFDRRHVMAASDFGGALCFGLMTLFTAPAALLGLRVLAAVAAAPLVPATSAALPSLVPPNELERANGALSKAGTVGMLAGPAAAAVVLTTIGGRWVFLLNALTFLISAGLILSIRRPVRARISAQHNYAAGFSFLRRHPILRPVGLAYGIAFIGIGVSTPAEIAVVASFGRGALGYAALICLWGVGMIAGATIGQNLAARPDQIFVIGAAASALAVGCLGVTASPLFNLVLLSMVIGGLGAGLWEVSQNCLMQRMAPDGIRARVLAANEALMQGGIAFGLALSGLVIGIAGARGAFALAGTTSALAAAVLFRSGSRLVSASEADAFRPQSASSAEPRVNGPRQRGVGRLTPSNMSSRPVLAPPSRVSNRAVTTA